MKVKAVKTQAFQLDSVRCLSRLTHWHDTRVQGLRVCRYNITHSSQQNFRLVQLFFPMRSLYAPLGAIRIDDDDNEDDNDNDDDDDEILWKI